MTALVRETSSRWFLIALLTLSSMAFSFALACAVPLAAFGAFAALELRRRDGVALVAATWAVNQAIGYAWLDYPGDVLTALWGVALLGSALAAMVCAEMATRATGGGAWARATIAFGAAFAGYEGSLYLAHFVLGGGVEAYAPTVLAEILWTNALAFAAFLGVSALARRMGFAGFVAPAPRAA